MTDAHCHPRDLLKYLENAEGERLKAGVACAANSWNRGEFEYCERLAKNAREAAAPALFRCFALHPQLSARFLEAPASSLQAGLDLLAELAAERRLDAVGETGFDLYGEKFRAAEKVQDEMFACHLETALKYGLPMVIHIRRAMHKIFPFAKDLKKLPAAVFHSWPGSRGEGEALVRRGINAFFSFGSGALKNRRQLSASAALLPLERLLLETDAPYQPLRGKGFSAWQDLGEICRGVAALRKEAGSPGGSPEELEARVDAAFYRVFGGRSAAGGPR